MLEPRGNAAMMRHQRRDATFREPTARVHRPPHGQPGSFFTLQTEACDPEASCECGCGVWVEGTTSGQLKMSNPQHSSGCGLRGAAGVWL
jgi:hypothetical protein